MIDPYFSRISGEQIQLLRVKVFDLLESHGVMLDGHPEMFNKEMSLSIKE